MEQMKRLTIVWGILMFLIFAVFTSYSLLWKKRTNEYRELEKKLVEAAKDFAENNFVINEQVDGVKITYNDLVNEEYFVDELKVNKDQCDGYVKVSYKDNNVEYKGYIKCEKYTTARY